MPPAELLQKYPAPVMVIFKDNTYGVLLRISTEERKTLVFLPKEMDGKTADLDEFEGLACGDYIVF
jgi:hypothetical protein